MGFKDSTSFLRYLTMGASGARQTMRQLATAGFHPIELERYCTSNKIWATKIKRLRLPDLLCARTGLRVEVRSKSDLKIKMSDAPNNPDRAWDAGLRDNDLIAFIACLDEGNGPVPADGATFFTVKALRDSVDGSKLGPPKSASEGSERDREWPATIPSCDGVVLESPLDLMGGAGDRLTVLLERNGSPHRRQTYRLQGKHAYVKRGDRFKGGASIIAGLPAETACLDNYLTQTYDPLSDLESPNAVDRYAAAKTIPYRYDVRGYSTTRLESLLRHENEPRVALEVAGAAARLGSAMGETYLSDVIRNGDNPELRMEAVFILTEQHTPFSLEELRNVARSRALTSELRQAAIWGLGKNGHRSYEDLIGFIDDDDEELAFHAIAAFGQDVSANVISSLAGCLDRNAPRMASAASEVLRLIGGEQVLEAVLAKITAGPDDQDWAMATLGRLGREIVSRRLQDDPLLERISPLLCLFDEDNWLASEDRARYLAFLLSQNY